MIRVGDVMGHNFLSNHWGLPCPKTQYFLTTRVIFDPKMSLDRNALSIKLCLILILILLFIFEIGFYLLKKDASYEINLCDYLWLYVPVFLLLMRFFVGAVRKHYSMSEKISQKWTAFVFSSTYLRQTFTESVFNWRT